MKFHPSLVNEIVRIVDMWGGRSNNDKLLAALENLDVLEYQQKNGNLVLVSRSELEKQRALVNQENQKVIR